MLFVYRGRKFNNTLELVKRAESPNSKNCHNVSLNDSIASTSGVVVLNVLWRVTVDMSNTAISLE